MTGLNILDEDIFARKCFASARDVNAMKFGQVFQFRAIALGDNCHNRLVVFKALKNEGGVNHKLINCQK